MDKMQVTTQEWFDRIQSFGFFFARFIERDIPTNWARWPISKRRKWWHDDEFHNGLIQMGLVKTCKRDRITGAEIWCEFFNFDLEDYQQTHARAINKVLGRIPTLTKVKSSLRSGPYGIQRGFKVQHFDQHSAEEPRKIK